MKAAFTVLAFLGLLILSINAIFSGYANTKLGINQYSCEIYNQPVDCIKK